MPQLDDQDRLRHMLEAAEKIQKFVSGKTRDSLDRDEILYSPLTWLFQVVGEAARYVTKEYQSEHPEFDWEDITNFRHRIVHGYDMIDKDIMWNIIEFDVPILLQNLHRALAGHSR